MGVWEMDGAELMVSSRGVIVAGIDVVVAIGSVVPLVRPPCAERVLASETVEAVPSCNLDRSELLLLASSLEVSALSDLGGNPSDPLLDDKFEYSSDARFVEVDSRFVEVDGTGMTVDPVESSDTLRPRDRRRSATKAAARALASPRVLFAAEVARGYGGRGWTSDPESD